MKDAAFHSTVAGSVDAFRDNAECILAAPRTSEFFSLGHPVYQWQDVQIRGHVTSSAYLKWGDRYVSYLLSGAP